MSEMGAITTTGWNAQDEESSTMTEINSNLHDVLLRCIVASLHQGVASHQFSSFLIFSFSNFSFSFFIFVISFKNVMLQHSAERTRMKHSWIPWQINGIENKTLVNTTLRTSEEKTLNYWLQHIEPPNSCLLLRTRATEQPVSMHFNLPLHSKIWDVGQALNLQKMLF